jgi:PEP-CTERM motif
MKISQIFAVLMLLVVGSVMAFADGIGDPQIIIHGAGGNSAVCPVGGCTSINGLTFNLKVPANGSGTLFFTNNSGQNWTSLALIETGVPAVDIKCHSSLFGSCSVETLQSGKVEILLQISEGNNPNSGIKNGQNFAITFACVKTSCWPGGLSVSGYANNASVPEPGTIALMVTGLGAMFSRRKIWKNRWNS